MGHPLIDQFCRVAGVANCQPHFFNRCQREFRDDVQPKLDERDRLLVEVDELKKANAALQARIAELTAPRPQPKGKATAATTEAA